MLLQFQCTFVSYNFIKFVTNGSSYEVLVYDVEQWWATRGMYVPYMAHRDP